MEQKPIADFVISFVMYYITLLSYLSVFSSAVQGGKCVPKNQLSVSCHNQLRINMRPLTAGCDDLRFDFIWRVDLNKFDSIFPSPVLTLSAKSGDSLVNDAARNYE